ncbi:MAG: DUF3417 domain-containing protein, partial [Planctomycetaceae bacterium]|nr:DUF3417 domain-containing protein [Planctomycetaceae bacterium]
MSLSEPLLSIHDKLSSLAANLWWSWDPEVSEVFRLVDPVRWESLNHNPVLLLKEYTAEKLEERAREA